MDAREVHGRIAQQVLYKRREIENRHSQDETNPKPTAEYIRVVGGVIVTRVVPARVISVPMVMLVSVDFTGTFYLNGMAPVTDARFLTSGTRLTVAVMVMIVMSMLSVPRPGLIRALTLAQRWPPLSFSDCSPLGLDPSIPTFWRITKVSYGESSCRHS